MKVKIKKRADAIEPITKKPLQTAKKPEPPKQVLVQRPKPISSPSTSVAPKTVPPKIHGNTHTPIKSSNGSYTYKELLESIKANLEGTIKKEIKQAVTPVTKEIRSVAKAATESKSWIEKKERKAIQDQINSMRDKLIRDIMREKKVPEQHFAGVRGKLMLELRNKGIKLGLDKKQLALLKESSGKRIETLKLESFINQAIAAKGLSVSEKPPSNTPGPIISVGHIQNQTKETGNFLDTLRQSQQNRLIQTAKQFSD